MSRRNISIMCLAVFSMMVLCVPSGRATIHEIVVGDYFFTPSNTEVQPGDTVRWIRISGTHTTTSEPSSPKSWDSGLFGSSFDLVFTESDGPGPFPYYCKIHPTLMKDTIFMDRPPDTVTAFGFQSISLGDAVLELDGERLVIWNIELSGDDGVSFDLSDTTAVRWGCHWENIQLCSPTGASIKVTAFGEDGTGDSEIGAGLMIQNVASDWEVSADFSAIGANTQTVLVLNGATVVASASDHAGIAAIASGPPNNWHWAVEDGSENRYGCAGTWDVPVEIIIPGTSIGPVMGNAVEIIPEDNRISHADIERIEMRLTSLDTLIIDYMRTSDVPDCCDLPGDASNSSGVNIGDVVYLVNLFFVDGPEPVCAQEGDVNGDSNVNVGDIVYLINYIFKQGTPPVCRSPLAGM